MNNKIRFGTILNGILFLGLSMIGEPFVFFFYLVGFALNASGIGLILSGSAYTGAYVYNVGAVFFVPLGFISFKGGIEVLDDAREKDAFPKESETDVSPASSDKAFYAKASQSQALLFIGPLMCFADLFIRTGFLMIGGAGGLYRGIVRKEEPVMAFYNAFFAARKNPFFSKEIFFYEQVRTPVLVGKKLAFTYETEEGAKEFRIPLKEIDEGEHGPIEKTLRSYLDQEGSQDPGITEETPDIP